MGRRYLNRNKNEEFDQDYDETPEVEEEIVDTGKKRIERVGPNIDDVDPFEVVLRQIAIEKDLERPKTKEERVKEEIKIAGHQTRTTNQYQKFVNAHIEERVSKIDKIRKAKEQFDRDINNLNYEHIDDIKNLSNIPIQKIAAKELHDLLDTTLKNIDITRSKLEYFRNRVIVTEKELSQQEQSIEKIRQEIIDKEEREKTEKNRSETIKKEIEDLSKKYNLDELRKVMNTLNKSNEVDT